jgi:thiamine biosynthesis lipoprotein
MFGHPRHNSPEFTALVALVSLIMASAHSIAQDALQRFELSLPTMGTTLEFVVYAPSKRHAQKTMDAGLAEINRLSPILSNYDPESEISKLCQTAHESPFVVSSDLGNILVHSLRWQRLSEGKFDITVGRLTQLWRTSRKTKQLPTAIDLDQAKRHCGTDLVQFNFQGKDTLTVDRIESVQLLAQGVQLDLSGLATGYIVDQAFNAMVATGLRSILINIGGDIRVGDAPPERQGWRVTLAGLGKDFPALASRTIQNCAVTTSGDLHQFVELNGRRYSHFIDPHSCAPVEKRQSVTVFSHTTLDADAGATAIAILGMERASEIFSTLGLAEAILLEAASDSFPAIRMRYLLRE